MTVLCVFPAEMGFPPCSRRGKRNPPLEFAVPMWEDKERLVEANSSTRDASLEIWQEKAACGAGKG